MDTPERSFAASVLILTVSNNRAVSIPEALANRRVPVRAVARKTEEPLDTRFANDYCGLLELAQFGTGCATSIALRVNPRKSTGGIEVNKSTTFP